MPTTIETTVYTFAELTEDAQEKAIEHLRDRFHPWSYDDADNAAQWIADPRDAGEHPWYPDYCDVSYKTRTGTNPHTTVDVASFMGEPFAIQELADIQWDTQSYECTAAHTVDVAAFMKAHKLAGKFRSIYNAAKRGDIPAAEIVREYRSGPHTKAEIDDTYIPEPLYSLINNPPYGTGAQVENWNALIEAIDQDAKDRAGQMQACFREDMEYRQSDEALREDAEANEMQFNADGSIYR